MSLRKLLSELGMESAEVTTPTRSTTFDENSTLRMNLKSVPMLLNSAVGISNFLSLEASETEAIVANRFVEINQGILSAIEELIQDSQDMSKYFDLSQYIDTIFNDQVTGFELTNGEKRHLDVILGKEVQLGEFTVAVEKNLIFVRTAVKALFSYLNTLNKYNTNTENDSDFEELKENLNDFTRNNASFESPMYTLVFTQTGASLSRHTCVNMDTLDTDDTLVQVDHNYTKFKYTLEEMSRLRKDLVDMFSSITDEHLLISGKNLEALSFIKIRQSHCFDLLFKIKNMLDSYFHVMQQILKAG